MKKLRILSASVLVLGMLFMSLSTPGALASPNPAVLPPDAKVQGLTLGEWQTLLWKGIFEIPIDENPAFGAPWTSCILNQQGNVGIGVAYVYSGSSDCDLPAGTMLYVLVVGSECSNAEPPPFYGGNYEELRACVLSNPQANLQASVDGVAVRNLENYTMLTPLYQLVLPEGNALGAEPGTYISVGNATGFMLAPLSAGEHTVHVHGEIPGFGFTYDWIYHITVTE